jgi:hypothetical protein
MNFHSIDNNANPASAQMRREFGNLDKSIRSKEASLKLTSQEADDLAMEVAAAKEMQIQIRAMTDQSTRVNDYAGELRRAFAKKVNTKTGVPPTTDEVAINERANRKKLTLRFSLELAVMFPSGEDSAPTTLNRSALN